MRNSLLFCAVVAIMLLSGCMKDISCYRDMIIGSWVEQTFDGQEIETNLRSVHIFNRSAQRTIACVNELGDNHRTMANIDLSFVVSCSVISTMGIYFSGVQEYGFFREEKVLRFTDTTLKVSVLEEAYNGTASALVGREILYKKVSSSNVYATTIQNVWEMIQSSDLSVQPFQIRFHANGNYSLFLKEENEWEEKVEEEGKYVVYDSFLTTSFSNNPIFGTPDKRDVACWNILFTEEEDTITMSWQAFIYVDGKQVEKRFLFTSVAETEENE